VPSEEVGWENVEARAVKNQGSVNVGGNPSIKRARLQSVLPAEKKTKFLKALSTTHGEKSGNMQEFQKQDFNQRSFNDVYASVLTCSIR